MSNVGRAIAREIRTNARFEGIPRIIVEAVIEETISQIEDMGLATDLSSLGQCEGCEEWFPEEKLMDAGEDGPPHCEPCLEAYQKELAEEPAEEG